MAVMMKKYLIAPILLFVSFNALASTSGLSYQYSVPYSGGAKLILTNHSKSPVTIKELLLTNNSGFSGTPWGSLWGWQSVISSEKNPDGIHTDFRINENPAISIASEQSAELTYNVDKNQISSAFQPYKVAMNPVKVSVVVSNSDTPLPVDIEGICNGKACDDPGHGKRIMGYFPNWAFWRNPVFYAKQLPFDKLNSVVYAFSIFDKDGKISLYDQDSDAVNLPMIAAARQQYPYLNASLSFGGWSWASTPPGWQCKVGASPDGPSACFRLMAADSAARAKFVRDAVKAMKEVQFNGIDIDWEYPQVSDANNYLSLLQELHDALEEQGAIDQKHYYLTIAVGAGIDKIQNLSKVQWQQISTIVDSIGVMTYDFHGSWDQGQTGSNFLSAMALDPNNDSTITNPVLKNYNVIDAMNLYLDNGIEANQLLVGIPVYGRMVTISDAGETKGLYRPITGTPQGEWDNQQSGFTGMLDYSCIVDKSFCGNGYKLPELLLVSPTTDILGQYALTPWGYSSTHFVSYDDANSATYKASWALKNNFGGVMLWDLTGDFPAKDSRSIVRVIQQEFSK